VRFHRYPTIRRGHGGPQKPTSQLSEGIGAVFTISTEISEKACVPHRHIFEATTSLVVVGAGKEHSLQDFSP
jgi:hypothetical protein